MDVRTYVCITRLDCKIELLASLPKYSNWITAKFIPLQKIYFFPCSCFGYFYPNQLEMERVRNEDLCMIIIDRGAVEDHLPNHVLAALQRFKRQSLGQSYREAEVERLREEAWREMNQKRKARALSSARGGAPFRSVSARRNPMEQRVSGSQIQHLTFILSPATPHLLKRGIP